MLSKIENIVRAPATATDGNLAVFNTTPFQVRDGGTSVASIFNGITRVLYVDQRYTGATESGTQQQPFRTLQAAINSIPQPVDAADELRIQNIRIAPGVYNEDVDYTGRNIVFTGLGLVFWGESGNFAKITLRWRNDSSIQFGNVNPILAIENVQFFSAIVFDNPPGVSQDATIIFNRSSCQSTITGTAHDGAISLSMFGGGVFGSSVEDRVNIPSAVATQIKDMEFFGGVFTVGSYQRVSNANFGSGFECASTDAVARMIESRISASVETPAGGLVIDAATDQSIRSSNPAFVAATSKQYLDRDFELMRVFAAYDLRDVGADWAVAASSASIADTNNAGLTVRQFSNLAEEGAGFLLFCPPSTRHVLFRFKHRSETAQPGAETVVWKVYTRDINDDGAVAAWTAGREFSAATIPTNENFQYFEEVLSITDIGVSSGVLAQWEITRDPGAAGDTLAVDLNLIELEVLFL